MQLFINSSQKLPITLEEIMWMQRGRNLICGKSLLGNPFKLTQRKNLRPGRIKSTKSRQNGSSGPKRKSGVNKRKSKWSTNSRKRHSKELQTISSIDSAISKKEPSLSKLGKSSKNQHSNCQSIINTLKGSRQFGNLL